MNEMRTKAWIGDAVLGLYAREWILRQKDVAVAERSEVFKSMTSNEFLSALGNPTEMEAQIGAVYEDKGLEAAYAFIEQKFLPVFIQHRRKPKKPGSWRDKIRAK